MRAGHWGAGQLHVTCVDFLPSPFLCLSPLHFGSAHQHLRAYTHTHNIELYSRLCACFVLAVALSLSFSPPLGQFESAFARGFSKKTLSPSSSVKCMSQKALKPTLTGQRLKTRKRGVHVFRIHFVARTSLALFRHMHLRIFRNAYVYSIFIED